MSGDFFSLEIVSNNDDRSVVALRGELDVANSEQVQAELVAAEGSVVVVDLSELSFIDSSGLTALVHAHDEITGHGRGFELRGASGSVQRVFEITGLSKLLR
jgi:anti-sigma B factor antagonist